MTRLPRPTRRARKRLGLVALLALPLALVVSPAYAADGSIDHVEPGDGSFQVLYSLPGAGATEPDLDTVAVSLDDTVLPAEAEPAGEAEAVQRTTILAIDVSSSMRQDNRFEEAQQAAKTFLDAAPDDLLVGIVTFASTVEVAQEPTLDRAASAEVIDGLTLSNQTRLYDGVLEAVAASGTEGPRSLLVLSDGRDTSETPIDRVTSAIELAQVKVDVVALAQSEADTALLAQLADAGDGSVITAADPEALTQVFADEAEALASQILVTVTPPDGFTQTEGTLSVSVDVGRRELHRHRVRHGGRRGCSRGAVPHQAGAGRGDRLPGLPPDDARRAGGRRPRDAGPADGRHERLLRRVQPRRWRTASPPTPARGRASWPRRPSRRPRASPPRRSASRPRSWRATRASSRRSDSASRRPGCRMKPAEWLLTHAGVAFAGGLLGLLLSSGSILFTLLGLFFGLVLPWLFLSFKRSRRTKAFKAQLADTLQLMSGSLSAGLSLAQAVDTVVREGADPMGSEFRRALVEARLGVEIEDALEGVAERMESVDFKWVVMAIRIQREVGGNLAELLNSVADTIREREYLERQVLALSAEGRLSVWILGGLPPGFMLYLLVANPTTSSR